MPKTKSKTTKPDSISHARATTKRFADATITATLDKIEAISKASDGPARRTQLESHYRNEAGSTLQLIGDKEARNTFARVWLALVYALVAEAEGVQGVAELNLAF